LFASVAAMPVGFIKDWPPYGDTKQMRLLDWAAWFLAATSIDGLQIGGNCQSLNNTGGQKVLHARIGVTLYFVGGTGGDETAFLQPSDADGSTVCRLR